MRHKKQFSVASCRVLQPQSSVNWGDPSLWLKNAFARETPDLFLLTGGLLCRLFRGRFLPCLRLGFVFFGRGIFNLLRFLFLLGEVGSFKALAAECDLGDADRGKGLTVSAQFLVLLLALVMKHENF